MALDAERPPNAGLPDVSVAVLLRRLGLLALGQRALPLAMVGWFVARRVRPTSALDGHALDEHACYLAFK